MAMRFLLLLLAYAFQLSLPLGLFLGVLHEEPDDLGIGYFFCGKNLVEVALELFSPFLDVLWAVVCDAEYLSLGEVGSE